MADLDSLADLALVPDHTGRIGTCEDTLSLAHEAEMRRRSPASRMLT